MFWFVFWLLFIITTAKLESKSLTQFKSFRGARPLGNGPAGTLEHIVSQRSESSFQIRPDMVTYQPKCWRSTARNRTYIFFSQTSSCSQLRKVHESSWKLLSLPTPPGVPGETPSRRLFAWFSPVSPVSPAVAKWPRSWAWQSSRGWSSKSTKTGAYYKTWHQLAYIYIFNILYIYR